MGHRRLACLLLIVFWAFPIGPSSAEDQPPVVEDKRPYTLTVGVKEWLSHGQSAHNIGDSGVNVRSELTWRGLNSAITELNADLVVLQRLLMNMSVGYGTIGSGTLLDQDWNGNNRTRTISETLSQSDNGSVLIISLTPGVRVVHWTTQDNPVLGGIDFLLGYQYWYEKYAAYGLQDIFPGGRNIPSSVNGITQSNHWHSLRLGTRATVPILSFLSFKASAFYIPVNYYRQDDVHHLRSDLQQDLSFLSTATGGNGVQLEGSLSVRVWRQLTAEAGYRYWDIKSGQGTITEYNADGSIGQGRFNVDNTKRQGVFFGINWIF
jgi:hypothetical protein